MRLEFQNFMAVAFSIIFKVISFFLICLAIYKTALTAINPEKEVVAAFVESISTFVIALSIFELVLGIGKEYASQNDEGNLYINIRRTITRFVGTVCIALVLESLIMIIKYSQLDLAGNLLYPVFIIISAGVLLISMGVFLKLTRGHTE